jgi:signal transduction histidine kinase
LYMLRKKTKDNEELTQYFDAIEAAFDKSSEIFEFSNIYEKVGSKKLEQINVGEVFDEAILLLPHRNVEVINNVHDLKVLADGMLRQLFYNLIDNSIKYGKTVSKISLNCEEGGMLFELVYEDNGVGVPMEDKLRIFDGYTTGGSGLGLKLVKRMIEVYGWHISEQGQPGYGARFVISIPKISS